MLRHSVPALYRDLAKAGARIIFIPSAFTEVTGEAHWHVLQRARAIENGCFVVSAAQTGIHEQERKTFGHSIIIDPWGNVLADADKGVGFIIADLDLNLVNEARNKIPSLRPMIEIIVNRFQHSKLTSQHAYPETFSFCYLKVDLCFGCIKLPGSSLLLFRDYP